MPKRNRIPGTERARQLLAQEAARIIVNHGIRDYRAAKLKAAEKLGFNSRGALLGNAEIEHAVSEHLQLFGRESHAELLLVMRAAALSAMQLLALHTPRLVGPVLNGTADGNSAVNLHVFADSPEAVAKTLAQLRIAYRPYERRLKHRRDEVRVFAGFQFDHDESTVEATVFPVDGIRQAPVSPIDGKPMQRADSKTVAALLRAEEAGI
jgi:hypothetical protein